MISICAQQAQMECSFEPCVNSSSRRSFEPCPAVALWVIWGFAVRRGETCRLMGLSINPALCGPRDNP